MLARRTLLGLVPLLALAGGGLALAAPAAPVTTFADASRLAVIGGSLLEIVYALGEEARVVARDTTRLYPGAATHLPDVGYMRALSPEGVLAVNPTAILALAGSGPPEALSALAKAGIPFEVVPETFTRAGILAKVDAVGTALGVEAKAAILAARLEIELDAAAALTAAVPRKKRVLFVLSAQGGKLMASGTGTAADGIIALAGAENAIAGYAGYKSLTDEAVIAAQPEAILLMRNAGDGSATETALLSNPAIRLTPAGRNHAVITMEGSYLLGFGPRTPAAIHDLAVRLYPDLDARD